MLLIGPVGDFAASFAIGLRMPTLVRRVEFPYEDEQRFTVYLVDPDTASCASWQIDQSPEASGYEVRQHGPRALFTELEAAYEWWQQSGRPEHTRFGLTVSADHQQIWLDHETNTVTPARTA